MRRVGLALLCATLLAGCGGDEEGPPATRPQTAQPETTNAQTPSTATTTTGEAETTEPAPVADPRAALVAVLQEGDCNRFTTPRFIRAAYGGRDGCIQASRQGATAAAFEEVSLDVAGRTASALVIPSGGPSDGQEVGVDLVLRGGVWKVDALRADVPVGP